MKKVSLGKVADVNWGDTSVTKASYVEEGYTAYSATGNDGYLPYYDYDRDAIVLSAIGARCGKTWFATGKWSAIKNTIRFWSESADLDNRYLYWLTADPNFWPRRGAAQPFITIGDARKLEIPLPPLEEQKRIAAILDQADALRRQRQRALNRLNQLGQSIFYEMFEGEEKKYPLIQLKEIIRNGDKINYGVVQPGKEVEEGVPVIRVGDLLENPIRVTSIKKIDAGIEKNYSRSRLKGDEILIGCVGSIGAVALANPELAGSNIARAVARIPIDSEKAHRLFVAEQIKGNSIQNYFRAETRTVAQPTLNIGLIEETPVRLPPMKQQLEFVEKVSLAHQLSSKHSAALGELNLLFSSLQYRAFRGEL